MNARTDTMTSFTYKTLPTQRRAIAQEAMVVGQDLR
jgi:hypothetical protein